MAILENLTKLVSENICKAQKNKVFCDLVYNNESIQFGKNNFLFFIKPELTVESDTINIEKILDLIFDKIAFFGLNVHDIRILSANYLDKFNLIEQHYGVIARISSDVRNNITESAKTMFLEKYGLSADDAILLGGNEFLKKYPFFNYYSLDCLWQNNENLKLASGTYSEKLKMDLETIYLFNGFNPRQLKHFTEMGKCIVTMNISGDISWSDARSEFAGVTNPLNANQGSLRRAFLDSKEEFGIPEVSQSYNGIHLSAGPVEALIELHRFDTDFSKTNCEKVYTDFPFGKKLADNFNGIIPDEIINLSTVSVEGKNVTVFDLTEDKDSDEAIRLLRVYLKCYY